MHRRGPLADSYPAAVALVVTLIVILVVHQYRARHPLMPVKQLATTFPVTGILIAMCASAAAVTWNAGRAKASRPGTRRRCCPACAGAGRPGGHVRPSA